MNKTDKKDMICFEVSPNLKRALKLAAYNADRTISAQIRAILEQALVKELAAINSSIQDE